MKQLRDTVCSAGNSELTRLARDFENLQKPPAHQDLMGFVYICPVDKRVTPKQELIFKVLCAAGHPISSRMVIIDERNHKVFYSAYTDLQRRVAQLKEAEHGRS